MIPCRERAYLRARGLAQIPPLTIEGIVAVQEKGNIDISAEITTTTAIIMYFDLIPENALVNVLRWTSVAPRSKYWRNFVLPREIIPMYGVSGELGKNLLVLFDTLQLENWIDESLGGREKEHRMVKRHQDDVSMRHLRDLVLFPGTKFRSLHIGYECGVDIELVQLLAKTTRSHAFSELERLSVVSHYDEWLPVVGNTLKSIAIQKVESGYLFDIPKYCPNLRELRLNNFDERLSEAFWERVGVHLEVLEIFEIHPSRCTIKHIKNRCLKLISIQIHVTYGQEIEYTKLLISYGERLKYALIPCAPMEYTKRAVGICSEARFELQLGSGIKQGNPSWSMMLESVGARLEKVLALFSPQTHRTLNNNTNWDKSESLKTIELVQAGEHHISELFLKPKPNLLSVTVEFNFENDAIVRCLDFMAMRTGALKDLHMYVRDIVPSEGFSTLLKMNKSLSFLRVTPINGFISKNILEKVVVNTVDLLLKFPAMEELDLYSPVSRDKEDIPIESISRLCDRNRSRRLCVTVYGYIYMR